MFSIKCPTGMREFPFGLESICNLLSLLRGYNGRYHFFRIPLKYGFQNSWDEEAIGVLATRNEYITSVCGAPVARWRRMTVIFN